ncbi:hypothetical protein [Salipaludibacillus agaradhaerens]|jgi:hypothetical protein|uniref:hypothetical protein n=1 Tax=Salipaludibacillus agaradhaerens TaxID=76935 RepID=UPI000997B4D0|nr:hypothetical protein [Salipaludibacillus agaradhaerens]
MLGKLNRWVMVMSLISFFCILSSCSNTKNISDNYPFLNDTEDNVPVTLLFSNESDLAEEHIYYDALIDVQQSYPDKLSNVIVISQEEDELIDYYNIDTYPTLLILDDLHIKLRIEGPQGLANIYEEVEFILLNSLEKAS